jgi:Type IV secretory system Conjugative DNA transfer
MPQWLIEAFRRRPADRNKALDAVAEARSREFRELAAAHDAFVAHAAGAHGGLELGTALASDGREIPIRLQPGEQYAHGVVQGASGSGKTMFLLSLLGQEISAGRPLGIIDCKADLYEGVMRWMAAIGRSLPPERREALQRRLQVVNPFDEEHLVPLNVCRPLPGISAETQAYEVTLALSRLFDSALGIHMESILRHLILLLMESRLTLIEAPLVLEDEILRGVLASRSAHPAVKRFFLDSYAKVPQASKDALANRLQALFLCENLRLMLGADDLIDLRRILDRGDYLLVFLGKGPNVPEEQVDILGSILFQLLLQATYARGSGAKSRYLIVLDEFFHLLDAPGLARRFESAITTVRSFGLSFMLIHHNLAQLPASLREIVLGNCDLVALFRTSGRNAQSFGDFLPEVDLDLLARARTDRRRDAISPGEIRRHQMELLQRLPSRTCFWYDRRKPHRAVRIRVPDLPPPHRFANVSEAALTRIIREEGWDRGVAALPKARLRAQIEARRQRLHHLLHPAVTPAGHRGGEADREPAPKSSRPKIKLG